MTTIKITEQFKFTLNNIKLVDDTENFISDVCIKYGLPYKFNNQTEYDIKHTNFFYQYDYSKYTKRAIELLEYYFDNLPNHIDYIATTQKDIEGLIIIIAWIMGVNDSVPGYWEDGEWYEYDINDDGYTYDIVETVVPQVSQYLIPCRKKIIKVNKKKLIKLRKN